MLVIFFTGANSTIRMFRYLFCVSIFRPSTDLGLFFPRERMHWQRLLRWPNLWQTLSEGPEIPGTLFSVPWSKKSKPMIKRNHRWDELLIWSIHALSLQGSRTWFCVLLIHRWSGHPVWMLQNQNPSGRNLNAPTLYLPTVFSTTCSPFVRIHPHFWHPKIQLPMTDGQILSRDSPKHFDASPRMI